MFLDEETFLLQEMRARKSPKAKLAYDNRIFLICLSFILFFVTFAIFGEENTFQCPCCYEEIDLSAGVSWHCKRCKKYNYSEAPDWQGYYYCGRCGTQKGYE